jgi:hypothetical protein
MNSVVWGLRKPGCFTEARNKNNEQAIMQARFMKI